MSLPGLLSRKAPEGRYETFTQFSSILNCSVELCLISFVPPDACCSARHGPDKPKRAEKHLWCSLSNLPRRAQPGEAGGGGELVQQAGFQGQGQSHLYRRCNASYQCSLGPLRDARSRNKPSFHVVDVPPSNVTHCNPDTFLAPSLSSVRRRSSQHSDDALSAIPFSRDASPQSAQHPAAALPMPARPLPPGAPAAAPPTRRNLATSQPDSNSLLVPFIAHTFSGDVQYSSSTASVPAAFH